MFWRSTQMLYRIEMIPYLSGHKGYLKLLEKLRAQVREREFSKQLFWQQRFSSACKSLQSLWAKAEWTLMEKSCAHTCRLETWGVGGGRKMKLKGEKKDDWKYHLSRMGLSFKQIAKAAESSALEVTSGKHGSSIAWWLNKCWPDPKNHWKASPQVQQAVGPRT